MSSYIERPFLDVISGAIGILCLFIVIFLLSSWSNSKIILNINASKMHGKYPMFVICNKEKSPDTSKSKSIATLVCRDEYLPDESLKADLKAMCESSTLNELSDITEEEAWLIFENFLNSGFNKEKFYIFSLIKPSGVDIFRRKLDPLLLKLEIESGYIPISEGWEFSLAIKETEG